MWLNAWGWVALIGAGSAVGIGLHVVSPLPLWVSLPTGILATWMVLALLDLKRWRASFVHISDDRMDAAIGERVVEHLSAIGINASYSEDHFEFDGETYAEKGIRCRQRDTEKVRSVIDHCLSETTV